MKVISEIPVKEGVQAAADVLSHGVDGVFLVDRVNEKNQLSDAHAKLFSELVEVCDQFSESEVFSGEGFPDKPGPESAKYIGLKLLGTTSTVGTFDMVAMDWGHGLLPVMPAAIWTSLNSEPLEQASELRNKNPWLLDLKHYSDIPAFKDSRFIDAVPVDWGDDRELSLQRIRSMRRGIGAQTVLAVHGHITARDVSDIGAFANEVVIPYEENGDRLKEIIQAARKINED